MVEHDVNYFKTRTSTREDEALEAELASHAKMIMRRMDANHDHMVGKEDLDENAHLLDEHFPGVSKSEFLSFIEAADKNKDGKLDHKEMIDGLASGLSESPELVEEGAVRRGFFKKVKKFAKKVYNTGKKVYQKVKKFLTPNKGGSTSGTSTKDIVRTFVIKKTVGTVPMHHDACVVCQYITERIETNVKQAGVIPGAPGPAAFSSFLEVATSTTAQSKAEEPFDAAAAAVIGSTRQSTRMQRQLERQKFNEIYRVADVTLDDVCEQGMPTSFYSFCQAYYQFQPDVVDGLRYQYRPADICWRVGMCNKNSYIAEGIHSRYAKGMPTIGDDSWKSKDFNKDNHIRKSRKELRRRRY